jgi:hypothetical protein
MLVHPAYACDDTVWHTFAMPDEDKEKEDLDKEPEPEKPKEIGGREGPDPTRYGDWEKAGRCIDF